MKNLMISFIVFFLISLEPIKIFSQEIEIDSTFNSSFEIFPFENIDEISSISMEGHVKLPYDTSLVRIILKDEYGYQYLILEAYSERIIKDYNIVYLHFGTRQVLKTHWLYQPMDL